MIRTLRALFLRCLLREKLLLLCFVLIGVTIWLSNFSNRTGRFWREKRLTTTALEFQAEKLGQASVIDAAAQKSASQLDATKTLDDLRLFTTIQQLSADAGLVGGHLNPATTKTSGNMSIHTLDYSVTRASWDSIRQFYQKLQEKAPYIGIVKFTLSVAGTQHTLALTVSSVSSVEVAH